MRILFVLPYGPSAIRVRSRMLLAELASRHDITLVTLAWNEADREASTAWRDRCESVHVVDHGIRPRSLGSLNTFRQPLQYTVSRSDDFARLVRDLVHTASNTGRPYDVAHVEHIRGAAAANLLDQLPLRVVFDAVDCLTELAALTRRYGPNVMVRRIASLEEPRTRMMETQLLREVDVVTVAAERDRRALLQLVPDAPVVVLPNGVALGEHRSRVPEEQHVVFTGKLSYHANSAAARLLVSRIWPLVRYHLPQAQLTIAGADPPRWLTRYHGSAGIRILANPPDMSTIIQGARVSVAPIVYSVGIQNKVLEAMAAGRPVVATHSATEGLLPGHAGVVAAADDPDHFAASVIHLLQSNDDAERMANVGYEYVKHHHAWPNVARHLERLYLPHGEQQKAA